MKRREASQKRQQNRLGIVMIALVVFMLFVVLFIRSISLREKQEVLDTREQCLFEKITEEQQNKEQLDELRRYMQTNKFIEETARQKLGLVYDDEVIFKIGE